MKKNVLIIDDCDEMQILLKTLLQSKGHHIDCTSNGEEALSLLSSCETLPDLILLDLQMPIMDGLSFLNIRGQTPTFKNIPVILMSAEDDVHLTGAMTNVVEVLKKPLNILTIVQAVERNSRLH